MDVPWIRNHTACDPPRPVGTMRPVGVEQAFAAFRMPDALTKAIESTRQIGEQVQKVMDANRKSMTLVADQLAMARQVAGLFAASEHHRRRAIIERKRNTAASRARRVPPATGPTIRTASRAHPPPRRIRSGPRPALNDRVLRHVSDRTARRVPSRPASRTPRTPSPGDEDRLRLHGLGPPRRVKMVVGLAELGELWCE